QGHDDEGQLEEIEEKGQQEGEHADENDEAPLTTGQVDQQVLYPEIAIDASETETEYGGAHQNEHHETRQRGRGLHGLPEQLPGEPATRNRHGQGTDCTPRPTLSRCGATDETTAEHEEDQEQRRDPVEGQPHRNLGKHAKSERPRYEGDDPRSHAPHQQHDNHPLVDRYGIVAAEVNLRAEIRYR